MDNKDNIKRKNSPELTIISDEELEIISHLYNRLNQYHYELIKKKDLTPVPNHPEDQINIIVGFFLDLNEELGIEVKDISDKIKSGEYRIALNTEDKNNEESVVFPDYIGKIALGSTIYSLFNIAHEMTHLIGIRRGLGNDRFAEVESLLVEKSLAQYLFNHGIINEREKVNQIAVNHNEAYNATKICLDISNLSPEEAQKSVNRKENQIRFIYGDIISTLAIQNKSNKEIGRELNKYLSNKNHLSLNGILESFNLPKNKNQVIDEYTTIIDREYRKYYKGGEKRNVIH